MRYPLLLVTTVCWALWFGGTIATFVFGLYFFHHLPHDTFGDAVDAMFGVWSKYELVLAGVGLMSAGLLMVTYPSRWTIGLIACLIAALTMAITFGLGLLPVLQGYRHQGMAGTPEYMRWHGRSITVQTTQAAILLGTGALLVAMGGKPRREPAEPDGVADDAVAVV